MSTPGSKNLNRASLKLVDGNPGLNSLTITKTPQKHKFLYASNNRSTVAGPDHKKFILADSNTIKTNISNKNTISFN